MGLIIPDEKVCVTCHNDESPTLKRFKFEEMVKKKIARPVPEAETLEKIPAWVCAQCGEVYFEEQR